MFEASPIRRRLAVSPRLPCLAPLAALALLALPGCDATPPDAAPSTRAQEARLAPATGPVTPVLDLDPAPVSRQLALVEQLTRMGPYVYFTASGAGVGLELWRTDGTPEGTTLVRDIIPGPWNTSPSRLTVWRDRLYFIAYLPWGGVTLYVSDGTAAGTLPHTVIIPDGTGHVSYVDSLVPTRNALCLSLISDDDAVPDRLLCAKETPQQLVHIPGPWEQQDFGRGLGYVFYVLDGVAYFDVDPHGNRKGWRTDGTPEGTSRFFVELLPGLSRGAGALTSFRGMQYFRSGETAQDRHSLWRTDGTPEGTVRVKPLGGPEDCFCSLAPVGDTLWLAAYTPETGVELWKSDGTADGTVLVKDLMPGTASSSPLGFLRLGGTTLFWADSPQGFGVWRTDGTAEGTVFVEATPRPYGGQVSQGAYYFQRLTPGLEQELWRTDGTAEGTALVKLLSFGEDVTRAASLEPMAEVNGTLVFRGREREDRFGPWRSDGTAEGTLPLVDAPGTSGSTPRNLTAFGPRLYFLGRGPGTAYGVWTTDGTAAGTVLLRPGVSTQAPQPVFGGEAGRVFFRSTSAEVGQELWVTDGTPGGTRLVRDIAPGAGSSRSDPVAFLGGVLYFRATEVPNRALELWRTDGTPEGTWPVRTLLPGGAGQAWAATVVMGGSLYFSASTPELGLEPWRTDGTPEGTRLVGDLVPGTGSSGAWPFSAVGSTLYLFDGRWLWKSDGTPGGTVQVKDLGAVSPMKPVVVGSTLYFLTAEFVSVAGFVQGYLWKTDGTPEGTVRVRETRWVEQLAAMGGALYFFEQEPVGTYSLWRTDGTGAGTWRVKEMPRVWWLETSTLSEMLAVEPEGRLIFAAADESGVEPWVSNGTPEGTGPLQDLYPGAAGSAPYGFARLGDHVYFAANDRILGIELWKAPVSALNVSQPGGGDAGTPDAGTTDDAGTVDAGTAGDAGTVTDAGTPGADAGTDDAGTHDAGTTDAGTTDAGTTDAGADDAGTTDAGTQSPVDAGPQDGGPDAPDSGCGCGATGVGAPWLMLVLSAWLGRRRRAWRH